MRIRPSKHLLFKRHVNTAWSLAGTFSRCYHRPYQDMKDIAEYALCLELFGGTYDPAKNTKLNSWLYTKIYYHLLNVCERGVHPCPGELKVRIVESREIPFSWTDPIKEPVAKSSWLEEILEEVSEEARALIGIILEAPQEIAWAISLRTPGKARAAVRSYLKEVLKWSPEQINRAWTEVCSSL